jgi:hypothetical protein
MLEAYLGGIGTCLWYFLDILAHVQGTFWVYALRLGVFFKEHLGCLGTWFDTYHGYFEHMIWRIFL